MISIFNNVVEHNKVESNRGFYAEGGFTIPELIVVVSIILTIFAFAGINLLNIIPNAGLDEITQSFMADAKAQQNSAMLGESGGASLSDYSIKINTDSYILCKGQVCAPGNFEVHFPGGITAGSTFEDKDNTIIFSALTGEIPGYNELSDYSISFVGVNNKSITVRFNKLGNVDYVNKN